jgi:UDP-N-acetylglucosamine 4-epimerase
MNNQSILITGGAGFIGSHIVEYLINKVKFVRVIDNLSTGNIDNIKKFLDYENFELVIGDITDINILKKAMNNIDIICHQAALGSVPRSIDKPFDTHNVNVNGFYNLLLCAKELNIKRVVYASSSSVYGDNETLPKVEHLIGNHLSPYAVSKYVNELYGKVFSRCYGMECIGLRYFNVFGPRQNPNGPYAAVIPKFIDSLLNNKQCVINGDGSYSRSFTFIDNVIFANVLALFTTNEKSFGEAFNIGTTKQITILQLYNNIKHNLGSNLDPIFMDNRNGDIPHSNADITKAKNCLGYKPYIDFSEGIKQTINYYVNCHVVTVNKSSQQSYLTG